MTPSAIYALNEIFGVAAGYSSAVEPQGALRPMPAHSAIVYSECVEGRLHVGIH